MVEKQEQVVEEKKELALVWRDPMVNWWTVGDVRGRRRRRRRGLEVSW